MIIAFCVGGILLPASANAADSCAQALLSKPSQNETSHVDLITALAQMLMDLDIAKASHTQQSATLAMLYKRKKTEVLQLPSMSEVKLAELLKSKILQLQGMKDPIKEEAMKVEMESRAAVRNLLFTKTHSFQNFQRLGGSKYLSHDEKNVVVVTDRTAALIDLKSGEMKMQISDQQDKVLYSDKQELLIALKGRELSTLDMKTQERKSFKLKEILEWSDVKSRYPRSTLAADQQSIIVYNDTHYYIYDLQTGTLMSSAKLAVLGLDGVMVQVLNKDSWILSGSGKRYIYNFKSDHWALLARGLDNGITYSSADGNQVLILADGGLIYYDSIQAKVLTKEFTPQSWITEVHFGKDPDQFSFVLQHDSDFAEHRMTQGLPMTEYMTLSKSDLSIIESRPWRSGTRIFNLPNEKVFVSSSYKDFPTGIYPNSLNNVLQTSTFEYDYSPQTKIQILDLLATKDGSKIITFTENHDSHKSGVDVWELGQ
jgi:hypothetical protein